MKIKKIQKRTVSHDRNRFFMTANIMTGYLSRCLRRTPMNTKICGVQKEFDTYIKAVLVTKRYKRVHMEINKVEE